MHMFALLMFRNWAHASIMRQQLATLTREVSDF